MKNQGKNLVRSGSIAVFVAMFLSFFGSACLFASKESPEKTKSIAVVVVIDGEEIEDSAEKLKEENVLIYKGKRYKYYASSMNDYGSGLGSGFGRGYSCFSMDDTEKKQTEDNILVVRIDNGTWNYMGDWGYAIDYCVLEGFSM